VRFLEGFADVLGLSRFALAAHDLGGMAAPGFAARRGERLTHLVVLDTAPYADWPLACRLLIAAARSRPLAALLLRPAPFRLLLQAEAIGAFVG
jgi:pimeloyl-ACP methyl ester carboxylesterase